MCRVVCNLQPDGFTLSNANSVYSCHVWLCQHSKEMLPSGTIMASADYYSMLKLHVMFARRSFDTAVSSLLTEHDWCASLLRNDRAGRGRGENLIPRTICREGHCSGTKYSQRHGWLAVRLFAQQNVSEEMWDLWLMGKGHGAWSSAVLLFSVCHFSISFPLSCSSNIYPPFPPCPFHSVLLFHLLLPDILDNHLLSLFLLLSSSVCSFQRLHWPARKSHPQHGSTG